MTTVEEAPVARGLPRLGEPAPDFEAVTTQGTVRLSDFRGSGLVLFSHPADFTPVCTTEFIGFAGIYEKLQERHTELLGLSVDSVYSHIACPGATDEDCAGALRNAGLADWLASLPNGLATRLGAGGRPLSGGERQRLGMARALLGGGSVLLLDEPTARLDPATKDQVLSGLLRAAQGRSLIVVTHEPAVEDMVDEVLELAGGRVVACRPGQA